MAFVPGFELKMKHEDKKLKIDAEEILRKFHQKNISMAPELQTVINFHKSGNNGNYKMVHHYNQGAINGLILEAKHTPAELITLIINSISMIQELRTEVTCKLSISYPHPVRSGEWEIKCAEGAENAILLLKKFAKDHNVKILESVHGGKTVLQTAKEVPSLPIDALAAGILKSALGDKILENPKKKKWFCIC